LERLEEDAEVEEKNARQYTVVLFSFMRSIVIFMKYGLLGGVLGGGLIFILLHLVLLGWGKLVKLAFAPRGTKHTSLGEKARWLYNEVGEWVLILLFLIVYSVLWVMFVVWFISQRPNIPPELSGKRSVGLLLLERLVGLVAWVEGKIIAAWLNEEGPLPLGDGWAYTGGPVTPGSGSSWFTRAIELLFWTHRKYRPKLPWNVWKKMQKK